jgi:hypothetical protein
LKWGFYGFECISCGWPSANDALPQEVTFSFYRGREALIHDVVVDTRLWGENGTLKEPAETPQHIEVWISSASVTEGFSCTASGRLQRFFAEQVAFFPPA